MDNNIIITIQELLKGRNDDFDKAEKVKLVRHKNDEDEHHYQGKTYSGSLIQMYRYDYQEFIDYQNEQDLKNFKNVDYIVSFIGEEGSEARFIGVFKSCEKPIEKTKGLAVFNFQEIKGFQALKDKVIINWGDRSWHLWKKDDKGKEVIRIDKGFKSNDLPVFSRYEDIILNYDELKSIIESNNSEWKSKLEACNCVYLILDKSNGKQYVGVTYKDTSKGWKSGIWNRWSEYAQTGHGKDEKLAELCKSDPSYAKRNFQWSILETLPLNVIPKVAIERESIYKEKLGTRKNDNYNIN